MSHGTLGRVFFGRLEAGSDILEAVKRIALENEINAALVYAIGLTSYARIGYYDEDSKKYLEMTFEEPMEILSCKGNVVRDSEGKPIVHLHAVLGARDGRAYGGHVLKGTKVRICEIALLELKDIKATRVFDEKTGLKLLHVE